MISEKKEDGDCHDEGDFDQHIGILRPNLNREAANDGCAQRVGNGVEAENSGTALFYIHLVMLQLLAASRVTFLQSLNFCSGGT